MKAASAFYGKTACGFFMGQTRAVPSLPDLEFRYRELLRRIAALSADIYAESARPEPDVIHIAQWRAERTTLSGRADRLAAGVVIERVKGRQAMPGRSDSFGGERRPMMFCFAARERAKGASPRS